MTFDPTTNRVQCELLTPEEEKALKVWTHGHEIYDTAYQEWINCPQPIWRNPSIYRGKPAPGVTSWWLNVYGAGVSFRYDSRSEADSNTLPKRIDVLRIDTCNGVSTAHLEGLNDE